MSKRSARAAVYDAPNTPFVFRDYPLRDAHRDEVLVRISMSTICRSDIHSWEGRRPNPCPGILGHEIIGVIDFSNCIASNVTARRAASQVWI